MKLKSFRVRNFHSLIDSGPIEVSEITTLIGANQAGKSSILLGLAAISMDSTFTAFDLTQLGGVSKRYLDRELRPEEIAVVEADFELGTEEREKISEVGATESLSLTKYYDNSYTVALGDTILRVPSRSLLNGAIKKINDLNSQFQGLALQHLGRQPNNQFQNPFNQSMSSWKNSSFTNLTAEKAIQLLGPIEQLATQGFDQTFKDEITKFVKSIKAVIIAAFPKTESELTMYEFLLSNLPRTVYFKSYEKLEDEVTLTELKQNAAGHKTFVNLLKLCDLRIDSLTAIEDGKQKQTYVEQASGKATKLLSKAWDQEALQVDIRYDGDKLMVFTKDSSAVETLLPPSSGSEGFQWFLGFFINFGASTEADYKNAILLLDDPGVYLHPSAHKNLLQLFENYLANNVTTVYTTHLPFLIPKDKLYRLRVVQKVTEGRSEVTSKFYTAGNKDTLYPIRAVLGVTLGDSLFVGRNTLVVEGPSDQLLISAMIPEFTKRQARKFKNPDDIFVLGAEGADVAKYYAILLEINQLPYAVIFDNDPKGISAKSDLAKTNIPESKIILLSKSSTAGQQYFDIEDLFPVDVYAKSFHRIYGNSIGLTEDDLVKKFKDGNEKISNKAKNLLKDHNQVLDKMAVAREIINSVRSERDLNPVIKSSFELLFEQIGKVIEI